MKCPESEPLTESDLLDTVRDILSYGEICDHCLGRFFGKRSFGLSDDARGRSLRIALLIRDNLPFKEPGGTCWICSNAFDRTDEWAERAVQALDGIEFSTFLVGTRVPPLIAESEEMVWSDLRLTDPEPLKSEMNREVGKAIGVKTGKTADLANPEIVIILDLAGDNVEIQVNPVFVSGRYMKYERGIPQTHWHCRACHGAGCERCNFTGKMYQDSVEELIGRPAAKALGGENAVLHGSGREDIDARMLGTGRPFVLEIVAPRRRTMDLAGLESLINASAEGRVSVSLSRWCSHGDVETIKTNKAHKKYRILVGLDGPVPPERLCSALSTLLGVTIDQRTPERVAHRRADKVRKRRVLDIVYVGEEDGRFLIEVTGEAGLYIKELISGDNGRTHPSLTEVLGIPARVERLDVIQVEGTEQE
ncbi:MAG TPA: tRNA pseudouridine(54/55) synthase Pus10 [Methanoregulaceae archaeon]|nr:tRNA pseudouridine(54/55) synthase Pus10 [Methanoregulaceae archaeon]